MKPLSNAIRFKAGQTYGETEPEDWGLLRPPEGACEFPSLVAHLPTGLVFAIGISDENETERGYLSMYAVPFGSLDEGSGPVTGEELEKLGRNACMMFSLATMPDLLDELPAPFPN